MKIETCICPPHQLRGDKEPPYLPLVNRYNALKCTDVCRCSMQNKMDEYAFRNGVKLFKSFA